MNKKMKIYYNNRFTPASLKDYFEKSRMSILLFVFFLLLAYGVKVFNMALAHDTEAIISVPDSLYRSWVSLGRFGLPALKKVLGVYHFNPYVASFLMFVTLIAVGIFWSWLFYELSFSRDSYQKRNWIFPTIFLTAPVMAEQLGFQLQTYEVALTFLFIGIALLCIFKALFQSKKIYFLAALIFAFVSFSCYQTLVPLFVSGAVACFLVIYDTYQKVENAKSGVVEYIKIILALVAVFFIAFVMYHVCNSIIQKAMNIVPVDYLSGQVLWQTEPVGTCLKNIGAYAAAVLSGQGIYYSLGFSITAILFLLYIIIRIKNKEKCYWVYLLSSLVLLLTPFMMGIVLAQAPKHRTELMLPFVTGFLIQYLAGKCQTLSKKYYVYIAILFAGVVSIKQSMITSRLFYSEYVQYEEAARTAVKITDRIDQLNLGRNPAEPLVFIGGMTANLNASSIPDAENLGMSYYASFDAEYGSFIMRNFFSTIGYHYQSATKEQIQQAERDAADMPNWPDTGSVDLKNGVIIVKLS